MIKNLSHIGIAVKDLERAVETYKSLFGLDASTTIEPPGLKVSMIKVGECHVELLQPTTAEGPIAKFIEKRGEGIQHICFEVENIERAIEALSAKGMEFATRNPQQGAEGLIVFLHPKMTHGVLIELVQK